jgi:phage tail-like protein
MSAVERRDVVINLLNENHEPIVSWRARNAFPCKYSGPQLKADANEVAIESLELAHEGLSLVD